MHDEQELYRHQWRALRRTLYHVCLHPAQLQGLEGLCVDGHACPTLRVPMAVEGWRQRILAVLAQRAQARDAWAGYEALLPLFGDTNRLDRAIAQAAPQICQEFAQGETRCLWSILARYCSRARDRLTGAKPTREHCWRHLDRHRRAINLQRHAQGHPPCEDVAELAVHLLARLQAQPFKDAPRTLEDIISYFFEFDPAFTTPYNEEMHSLAPLLMYTSGGGEEQQQALTHALTQLPADLRHAVEWRFRLSPQPILDSDEAYRRSYGCSQRALRARADRGVRHLRELLHF